MFLSGRFHSSYLCASAASSSLSLSLSGQETNLEQLNVRISLALPTFPAPDNTLSVASQKRGPDICGYETPVAFNQLAATEGAPF